jgi:hypothetical protein
VPCNDSEGHSASDRLAVTDACPTPFIDRRGSASAPGLSFHEPALGPVKVQAQADLQGRQGAQAQSRSIERGGMRYRQHSLLEGGLGLERVRGGVRDRSISRLLSFRVVARVLIRHAEEECTRVETKPGLGDVCKVTKPP